jgi:xanthine dehydrogenase YagS FAD-binding subunit
VAPHPSTLAVALLAYDATVTTNERSGLTIGALLGDGTDGTVDNRLNPGEYIVHVDLPAPLARERAGYHRAIGRAYAEWPLVETVVRAVIAGEQFEFIRVTAGGIAPVPLRFLDTEEALASAVSDEANIRRAAALAVRNAKPLSGTAYKLRLLEQQIVDVVQSLMK